MRKFFLICLMALICTLTGSYVLADQPGGADPLLGTWENVNPDTGGLVLAEFYMVGDQLMIQVWGACVPEYCDWGEASVILYSTSVADSQAKWGTAEYDQVPAYRRLGIMYNAYEDMVTIYTYSEMTDQRYNYRMTDEFVRSLQYLQ